MTKDKTSFAAGQRILVRDAEWLILKTEVNDNGQFTLSCIGTDDLTRGQERIFITQLDNIEVIDPAETKLVADTSRGYEFSKLFLEANLRQMPLTSKEPDLENAGVFDSMKFQEDTVHIALGQLRTRLLLADAVGLGKTIQVGMILSELIRRGKANRILVLAKKSMLLQFQSELWNRFNIPLVRLDSEGIAKLRLKVPANKNPFEIYHRVIISIDTLKNVGKYEHYLKSARWDVVIIDEAHNVAGASVPERHLSYRLARVLSQSCDNIILTTATPHNGKRETFGRLISLLDPSIIPDPTFKEYNVEDIKGFFLMRFKEDVREEAGSLLSNRKVIPLSETTRDSSLEEENVYSLFAKMRSEFKKEFSGQSLLQYGMYKIFLSSPEACKETVDKRLKELSKTETKSSEIEILNEIKKELAKLKIESSSRYRLLVDELKKIGWTGKKESPRVLVFTEYRKTQDHLAEALAKEFKLDYSSEYDKQTAQSIATISGSTPDIHLTKTVEAFSSGASPIRILIATDVASEGVNLHHECNLIIHYDLPWSIITLIQRNGRIDRLGQTKEPVIRYLFVNTKNGILQGDKHIFDRLISKVEEINRLRRSGESILKLYDEKEEERFIAEEGILKGNENIFETKSDQANEGDYLEEMLKLALQASKEEAANTKLPEPSSLITKKVRFYSNQDFLKKAYSFLQEVNTDYPPIETHGKLYEFSLPPELRRRLGMENSVIQGYTSIPEEAFPEGNVFRLTEDKKQVMLAMEGARKTSGYWSKTLYTNETHPVLEWLVERVIMHLDRGVAPVVYSSQFAKGELCYCFIGQVNSKGGTPIVVNPHSVLFHKNGTHELLSLEEAITKTNFLNQANSGKTLNIKAAEPLKASAVKISMDFMKTQKLDWEKSIVKDLRSEDRRLKNWKQKRTEWLDAKIKTLSDKSNEFKKYKNERTRIEEYYENRKKNWENLYFKAEDEPTTKLVLLIVGE
ncbi:MAG: DEAD/DEAH box helicase [Leptospiraceae bacterium]|nr:DEAD/DEAH box helicase [Leptospiraceae bacterium]